MGLIECWRRNAAAISAVAILAAGLSGAPSLAQPISPPGGQLKCDVEGGLSYIVGSSRRLDCVYAPTDFPPEFYKGSINKIGIDLGFQRAGVIVWAVLSPGLTNGPGSLSGAATRSCSSRLASAAISASTSLPASATSRSLTWVDRRP